MLEKHLVNKNSAKANRVRNMQQKNILNNNEYNLMNRGDLSNLMITKEDVYKAYNECCTHFKSGEKLDPAYFFR